MLLDPDMSGRLADRIAGQVTRWKVPTVGGEGYAASTIYAELRARHPVEVWVGPLSDGHLDGMDGTKVRYSFGEHAVTLTGVSPTAVRVNDPAHGTQYWVSKATFEASWRDFNNMAVIFK